VYANVTISWWPVNLLFNLLILLFKDCLLFFADKYMEPCNLSPALAAVMGQDKVFTSSIHCKYTMSNEDFAVTYLNSILFAKSFTYSNDSELVSSISTLRICSANISIVYLILAHWQLIIVSYYV